MSQPTVTWATHADIIDIIAKVERRLREEPDMGQRGVILNEERTRWEKIATQTEATFSGASTVPPHDPRLTPFQVDRVLQALTTIHQRLQREARAAIPA